MGVLFLAHDIMWTEERMPMVISGHTECYCEDRVIVRTEQDKEEPDTNMGNKCS